MIYRITVYPEIPDDPICHQSFEDENEMNVDEVLRVLGYFVVKNDSAYKDKEKMRQALDKMDYIKFYKLVEKTAKRLGRGLKKIKQRSK